MFTSAATFENWVMTQEELNAVLAELAPGAYSGPERRDSERHPLVMNIEAVPLNEAFEPLSVPTYKMFSSDISDSGIGLVYVHAIQAKFLALAMHRTDGSEIRLMTEVVRCEPTELDGSLFSVGTKFVTR